MAPHAFAFPFIRTSRYPHHAGTVSLATVSHDVTPVWLPRRVRLQAPGGVVRYSREGRRIQGGLVAQLPLFLSVATVFRPVTVSHGLYRGMITPPFACAFHAPRCAGGSCVSHSIFKQPHSGSSPCDWLESPSAVSLPYVRAVHGVGCFPVPTSFAPGGAMRGHFGYALMWCCGAPPRGRTGAVR